MKMRKEKEEINDGTYLKSANGRKSTSMSGRRLGKLNAIRWPVDK